MKLEDFNVKELKGIVSKYNKSVGLKGYSKLKKDDLIKHLRNSPNIKITETDKGVKIVVVNTMMEENVKPKKEPKKITAKIVRPKKEEKKEKPLTYMKDGNTYVYKVKEPKPKKEPKKEEPKKEEPKPKKEEKAPADQELKKALREVLNNYYDKLNDLELKVLNGKVIDESNDYEEKRKEIEEKINEKILRVKKKYGIEGNQQESKFFESKGLGYGMKYNPDELKYLKNDELDIKTLPNFKKLTKTSDKIEAKAKKKEPAPKKEKEKETLKSVNDELNKIEEKVFDKKYDMKNLKKSVKTKEDVIKIKDEVLEIQKSRFPIQNKLKGLLNKDTDESILLSLRVDKQQYERRLKLIMKNLGKLI